MLTGTSLSVVSKSQTLFKKCVVKKLVLLLATFAVMFVTRDINCFQINFCSVFLNELLLIFECLCNHILTDNIQKYRSCRLEVYCKKGFFKNFTKFIGIFHEIHSESLYNKVAGLRHSNTIVFLGIFQNFQEHLFYRSPPTAAPENTRTVYQK